MNMDDNSSVVPLFIKKLKLLVDDELMDEYIAWDSSGESFHIFDSNRLAKEVLPLYFKHNNISSFIRQLNMYGFRKLNRTDSGGVLRLESDEMEFYHAYFKRNRTDLLIRIQRKPKNFPVMYHNVSEVRPPRYTSSLQLESAETEKTVTRTEFGQLVEMVKHIKNKQDNSDQRMELLKLENEQLLRDLNDLRTKHENQANVVQTLFSFLTSYATDNRSYLAAKRKLALPTPTYDTSDQSSNSRAVVVLNNSSCKDINGTAKAGPARLILQSSNPSSGSKKIARLTTVGVPTSNEISKSLSYNQSTNGDCKDDVFKATSPESNDLNGIGNVTIEEVSAESNSSYHGSPVGPSGSDPIVIRLSSTNSAKQSSGSSTAPPLVVKQEPIEDNLSSCAFAPYKKIILHPSIKKEIDTNLDPLRLNKNHLENFGYRLSQGEDKETRAFFNSSLMTQLERRNDPNVITDCNASSSDAESHITDVLSPLSDGQEVIPVSSINRNLDLPIPSSVLMSATARTPTATDFCRTSDSGPDIDTIWHHPDIGLPSPSIEMNNLFDSQTDSPVSNDDFIDSLLCSSDNSSCTNQPQFSSVEPQSPLALANLNQLQKSSRSS